MERISMLTIIILSIYNGVAQLDALGVYLGFNVPLFAGAFTGFLMGDLQTGLEIGATLQLMTLGVATYGGASIPDYRTGAIMGTAFAIISGQGAEYGIGLAVPIGLLLTQFDVFGRMANTFFQHKADACVEDLDLKGIERNHLLGSFSWMLSRAIPLFIGLYFGETIVVAINEFIPEWVMTGLKMAGSMLPAMGIALLLTYLPIKKFYPYLIIGFVLMAYGAGIFTVLGVALVGLALAGIYHLNGQRLPKTSGAGDMEVEIEVEEVEIDG